MKRKTKVVLLSIFIMLLLVFTGYFLLAFYYRTGFSLNTWINGVYCTGKSVEEVNSELLTYAEAPSIVITDKDGEAYTIDFDHTDYTCDYRIPLTRYMENQNPYLWVDNITLHKEHTLAPSVSFDEKSLRAIWENLPFVAEEQNRESAYEIRYSAQNGYLLYDGFSDRIDLEKAFQALEEALEQGEQYLDLAEADCYYDVPFSERQEKILLLWQKIEAFQNCDIVYDMGAEQIPLTASITAGFLLHTPEGEVLTDDSGNLMLDEEGVRSFISKLSEEYDTYGMERSFQSTRGDIVTVTGGTYGTKLNQKEEIDYLMEHLLTEEVHTGEAVMHIPVYEKEALVRGKDDIGTTYIEVDMTEQKMYYYADGKLELETEIVTGNTGRRMGTPEGVNYVYGKQKNRILRGPGYASPVKYWMPVKGNIGIHDAGWRSEFGGTIYKTNGSHGCINTPMDKMAELYDMVEVGTPVIMFY